MKLEDIMLSEITQTEREMHQMISLSCEVLEERKNWTNKTEAPLRNQRMDWSSPKGKWLWGMGGKGGKGGKLDMMSSAPNVGWQGSTGKVEKHKDQ